MGSTEFYWMKKPDNGYTKISQLGYYNTPEWKKLRLLKLSEKPLCETCNKPAVLVDHIKPITLDNTELFFDYNNLQSLCDSCHRIKTRKDNSRFSKLEAGKILQKQMEND